MRRVTSKTGFSTLEMIVTTLLLALSMTVLTSGASAVSAIYRRTLAKADAQMIYSQIETNLRAELTFADKVDNFNDVKKYYIKYGGDYVEYTLNVGDPERLDVTEGPALYTDFDDPSTTGKHYHSALSPTKQQRLENLTVIKPTIAYANGYFTVSGLQVKYGTQTMIDADTPSFMIRAANKVEIKP